MISFNEDEIDVLKEIINISYGLATSLITNTAGNHVALSVPEIAISCVAELQPLLEKLAIDINTCIITNQRFNGAYVGESLFLISAGSASNFAALMLDEDIANIERDDADSCALELSNILTSVSIGKLAEMLDAHMTFAAPNLLETSMEDFTVSQKDDNCEQFFIVKTWLSGAAESIVGYLLIFINEESFLHLRETLLRFIENHA